MRDFEKIKNESTVYEIYWKFIFTRLNPKMYRTPLAPCVISKHFTFVWEIRGNQKRNEMGYNETKTKDSVRPTTTQDPGLSKKKESGT